MSRWGGGARTQVRLAVGLVLAATAACASLALLITLGEPSAEGWMLTAATTVLPLVAVSGSSWGAVRLTAPDAGRARTAG